MPILIPNVWKQYKSTGNNGLKYNAILRRRVLDIHCYYFGDPIAYHMIGRHHFPEAPEPVFRMVRPQEYRIQRMARDESTLLIEYLWPKIDFEELERLTGRPPEEW